MKADDVKVGGVYLAKVGGRVVRVRLDAIRTVTKYGRGAYGSGRKLTGGTVYDVTNLATGRTTTFRSAAKFRGIASATHSPIKMRGDAGHTGPVEGGPDPNQLPDGGEEAEVRALGAAFGAIVGLVRTADQPPVCRYEPDCARAVTTECEGRPCCSYHRDVYDGYLRPDGTPVG